MNQLKTNLKIHFKTLERNSINLRYREIKYIALTVKKARQVGVRDFLKHTLQLHLIKVKMYGVMMSTNMAQIHRISTF